MHNKYETAEIFDYALLKRNARANRKFPTEAEQMLWQHLRHNKLGVRFRRQHIIQDYIADFVCLSAQLIVEVDGLYHCAPEQQAADRERTLRLEAKGFKVIRFSNQEVATDPSRVADTIFEETVKRIRNKQSTPLPT